MGIANEIEFENDICAHLSAHGWLYSPNDDGYDRERALFPEGAIAWSETTPATKTWANLAAFHNGVPDAESVSKLNKAMIADGTLHVLRHGFKTTGAGATGFSMVQYKPAFGSMTRSRKLTPRIACGSCVRFTIRQVIRDCIDLVLVSQHGIPVATS